MKKLLVAFLALFGLANASDVVVGGKNFTEQQFLSEMTAQLFEANGISVDKAIVIVNREEGGEELLLENGIKLYYLVKMSEILKYGAEYVKE